MNICKALQACSGCSINMQVTAASAAKHASTAGFHCRASPSSAACASSEAAKRAAVQTHLNGHSQAELRQGEDLADNSAAPGRADQPHAAAPAAAGQTRAAAERRRVPLMGCPREALKAAGAQPAAAQKETQGKSSTKGGHISLQGVLLPSSSVCRAESSEGKGAVQAPEGDEQQWNSSGRRVHVPHRGELANGIGEAHVCNHRDRQRPASGSAAQRGSEVASQRAKRGAGSCPEPLAKRSKCQEAFTLPDYGSSSSCTQDSASLTPEQSAQSKAGVGSAEHMSAQKAHPPGSAASPQPANFTPGPSNVGQALQAAATPDLPLAEPLHRPHSQQAAAKGLEKAHAAAQLPSTGAGTDEDTVMAEACHAPTPLKAKVALVHCLGAPTADSLGAGAAAAPDDTMASRFTVQKPLSPELADSQSPVAVSSAAARQPIAKGPGPASAAPEQGAAPAMEDVPLLSAASAAPAAELETAAALEDALELSGADPEVAMALEGSPFRPARGPSADTEALVSAADIEADAAAAAATAGQQPGGAADQQCLQESAHMGFAAHPAFTTDSSDAIPQEPIVVALRSDGTQICVTGVRCSFFLTPRHLNGWRALNNQMPHANDVLTVSCKAYASL